MSQVLVVDDDSHVRDLVRRALAGVHLACDTASDGREAFDRFTARRHNAVVTDLRMPRQHGHALAVDLLNRPEPPHVVVMTGRAEQRLVHDLISRGVQDIFWKPFDYNVLALKLLSFVEKSKRSKSKPAAESSIEVSNRLTSIERSLLEITAIFADSLAGMFEFDFEISAPPEATTNFIERFARIEEQAADRHHATGRERREAARVACARSVIAVPVDRQFRPEGEPFSAAIRDVSESGIRLLHTRSTNSQYLALSWRAESLAYTDIRVVMKVTRCKPMSPFYDISGQFVMAD